MEIYPLLNNYTYLENNFLKYPFLHKFRRKSSHILQIRESVLIFFIFFYNDGLLSSAEG